MKKIFLLSVLAVSFFAAEAQSSTRKSKNAKKPKLSSEAIFQARQDTLMAQRQQKIDSALAYQLQYDSSRRENERIAYQNFQQRQKAWKDSMFLQMDSSNTAQWKTMSKEHEHWLSVQKQRAEINRTAKLSDYQKVQVNYINQTTFEKAKLITSDSILDQSKKKEALTKLNTERRDRIRTVTGKAKEKRLEKARKAQSTSTDSDAMWINEVEGFVKN